MLIIISSKYFEFNVLIYNKFMWLKNNSSGSKSASSPTPQKATMVHKEANTKVGLDVQV